MVCMLWLQNYFSKIKCGDQNLFVKFINVVIYNVGIWNFIYNAFLGSIKLSTVLSMMNQKAKAENSLLTQQLKLFPSQWRAGHLVLAYRNPSTKKIHFLSSGPCYTSSSHSITNNFSSMCSWSHSFYLPYCSFCAQLQS
jgi:hypothetical protein